MKRANRLKVLNEEISKINKEQLMENIKKLNEKLNELKAKEDTVKKPFLDKIEQLKKQIEKLEKEMDDAVLSIRHEITKICDKARDIKYELLKRERLLNEKRYLEFLEQIKNLVDNGWIIYRIDMATHGYEYHEYELGELIGISSNWNTPSTITDIKLSEKTFKIKSEIAKNYRTLSLGKSYNYPRYCTVVLLTGIKPKNALASSIKCDCEKTLARGIKVPSYAVAKKKCPICEKEYYYECENCGKVIYPEPQCEHKDMIKEDEIKEKILSWEEETKGFLNINKLFEEDW